MGSPSRDPDGCLSRWLTGDKWCAARPVLWTDNRASLLSAIKRFSPLGCRDPFDSGCGAYHIPWTSILLLLSMLQTASFYGWWGWQLDTEQFKCGRAGGHVGTILGTITKSGCTFLSSWWEAYKKTLDNTIYNCCWLIASQLGVNLITAHWLYFSKRFLEAELLWRQR